MKVLSGSTEKVVARKGIYKLLEIVDFKGRRWYYLMTKGGVLLQKFAKWGEAHDALVDLPGGKYYSYPFLTSSTGIPGKYENPGEAWHQSEVERLNRLIKADREMGFNTHDRRVARDEHDWSASVSHRQGIPNPTKKKSLILPIVLIVGLVWLIYKNK